MKLCAGISKDCVNSFIGEKVRQYFGKKSPGQELDDILSHPETQEVLEKYHFGLDPKNSIKKSDSGNRFAYHAVLTNDQARNYVDM